MRDQAVAEQRVISEKVNRVKNDADVRSLGHLQTRGKKTAQSSQCEELHMSLALFHVSETVGRKVHESSKRPS